MQVPYRRVIFVQSVEANGSKTLLCGRLASAKEGQRVLPLIWQGWLPRSFRKASARASAKSASDFPNKSNSSSKSFMKLASASFRGGGLIQKGNLNFRKLPNMCPFASTGFNISHPIQTQVFVFSFRSSFYFPPLWVGKP